MEKALCRNWRKLLLGAMPLLPPPPPPAPGVGFCCCAICCAVSGFIPSARCLACANCGLVCTNCLGGRVLISLLTYVMRLPGSGWSLKNCGERLGYFCLMI